MEAVSGRYATSELRAVHLSICFPTEVKFLPLPAKEYIQAVTQVAIGLYAISGLRAVHSVTSWTEVTNC